MSGDFPPLDHLGYSLDMTSITPLDITAVVEAEKKAHQLLEVPLDPSRKETIGGVIYDVPNLVTYETDVQSLDGELQTYASGIDASTAFSADATLSMCYGAVSGSVSASYAYSKSFSENKQWALYSGNFTFYTSSLRNYGDYFNEERVKKRLGEGDLPNPFQPDSTCADAYKDFFSIYGTHVITGVDYGARYQLTVCAENSKEEVNENFGADVKADYNGVTSGGSFDGSVKSESQYKAYSDISVNTISVRGGDVKLRDALFTTPGDYSTYTQWIDSSDSNPDIMNLTTIELWELMKDADSETVRDYAQAMHDAYIWIIQNPQMYETKITFNIESDWAEFGLMTPSGTCVPNGSVPDNTQINDVKVIWGREHSHVQKRQTVEFSIINDGSPIDFYISHGSDGSQPGEGNATIVIDENPTPYVNDQLTDNNWNTLRFYNAPLDGKKPRE